MKLTKYAHACVALEKDGARLVVDPGTLTAHAREAVAGAQAVLVTHDHFDHFDDALVAEALGNQPQLKVYGPPTVREQLGDHGGRVQAVAAGDSFSVGPMSVRVFGDRHAMIDPVVPVIDNVGYLIDGTVFHPGDAYFAPDVPIDTLLLPTSGPWTKLGEAAEYLREVGPARVVQIHELMLSELGQRSTAGLLSGTLVPGTDVAILAPGETLELDAVPLPEER